MNPRRGQSLRIILMSIALLSGASACSGAPQTAAPTTTIPAVVAAAAPPIVRLSIPPTSPVPPTTPAPPTTTSSAAASPSSRRPLSPPPAAPLSPPPAAPPTTRLTTAATTAVPSTRVTASPAATGDQSAVQAGTGWLIAYRQASYQQPATAWITRVRPFVTDTLYASYLPLQGRGAGAGWTIFVAGKCRSAVIGAAGIIPPEAPRTATALHIQVSGTLHTTCTPAATGIGIPPTDQPLAATVTVVKTSAGWRVAAREY